MNRDISARQGSRTGVVERVTGILDAFLAGPHHLLLEDVTSATGLPRSTAFRILGQLVDLGWLTHDDTGYRLGARAHGLRDRGADHDTVRGAAAGALNDLALATGAVAHLGVLEGGRVRYLDKVGGAAAAAVPSSIGARLSAEYTVSGRALLACLAPEQVDTLLATTPVADPDRLHRHLDAARRRRGLVFGDGARCPLGIGSVAAPILGPHGAVAAISLAGRGLRAERVAPLVASATARTARLLFPQWSTVDGRARAPGQPAAQESTRRPDTARA